MYSGTYYDLGYYENEANPKKISKFVGLSSFIHATFVVVLFVLSQNIEKPVTPHLITIELLDHAFIPPKGVSKDLSSKAKAIKNIQTKKITLTKPSPKMRVNRRAPVAQRASFKSKAPKAPVYIQPKAATLDDIQAPDVESFGRDLEAPKQINFNEVDLQKDFEAVDQKSQVHMQRAQNILTTEAQDAEQEVESSAAIMKAKNQKFKSKVSGYSQRHGADYGSMEAENQNAINSEVDGLERYASGLGGQIDSHLNEEAGGAGSSGQGSSGGEVRSLGDLKQKPGNAKPQYGIEDRLRRHQGQVVYVAYVQKNGTVSNFKLIKSSGFASLDERTVKALKRWKFYPGQEGWVELPFKWDLKGGVQELPALLRTNRSVTIN